MPCALVSLHYVIQYWENLIEINYCWHNGDEFLHKICLKLITASHMYSTYYDTECINNANVCNLKRVHMQ